MEGLLALLNQEIDQLDQVLGRGSSVMSSNWSRIALPIRPKIKAIHMPHGAPIK